MKHWITFALMMTAGTAQAGVPKSWINGAQNGLTTASVEETTGTELETLIDASDMLASTAKGENDAEKKAGWYLQSIKTEIGVEAEGELGLVEMGGEGAVELIWMRTPQAVERIIEKRQQESDVTLSSAMSESAVKNELDAVVDSLAKMKKVRNIEALRENLRKQVLRVHETVAALANAPEGWAWRPYKFQLQLYVEAEGHVAPIIEVGPVARVRLEWNIERKSGVEPRKLAMLEALSQDLAVLEGLDSEGRMFRLTNLKLGVGVGVEGDIGIAETKQHVIGSVFLKKVAKVQPAAESTLVELPMIGQETRGIPREEFRKGLAKAEKIARFVTDRAEKSEMKKAGKKFRQFELGAIEVEFEVEASGGIFLPTVSKLAVMEIFFTRSKK